MPHPAAPPAYSPRSMNWLAHLLLSPPDNPRERLGNWLADILPVQEALLLGDDVAAGVRSHLEIDRFTDRHPLHWRSREKFAGGLRRFSGILTDVAYDHFLSRDFPQWAGVPLDEFIRRAHEDLSGCAGLLPSAAASALRRMIRENWLGTYVSLEGYELTLTRIRRRLSPRAAARFDPSAARAAMEAGYAALDEEFQAFFPELRRHMEEWSALRGENKLHFSHRHAPRQA
jgi:acyl carrier protein phosphodiesterase